MHPILAEQELRVFDRRHHELIASVERNRTARTSLAQTPPNGQSSRWIGRGAIEMLATRIGHLPTGFARRQALEVHAETSTPV